jgi:hypothetical protein
LGTSTVGKGESVRVGSTGVLVATKSRVTVGTGVSVSVGNGISVFVGRGVGDFHGKSDRVVTGVGVGISTDGTGVEVGSKGVKVGFGPLFPIPRVAAIVAISTNVKVNGVADEVPTGRRVPTAVGVTVPLRSGLARLVGVVTTAVGRVPMAVGNPPAVGVGTSTNKPVDVAVLIGVGEAITPFVLFGVALATGCVAPGVAVSVRLGGASVTSSFQPLVALAAVATVMAVATASGNSTSSSFVCTAEGCGVATAIRSGASSSLVKVGASATALAVVSVAVIIAPAITGVFCT